MFPILVIKNLMSFVARLRTCSHNLITTLL